MSPPRLEIVVPCYNEEEALPETAVRLQSLLETMIGSDEVDDASSIIFVDDGSADRTWHLIEQLSAQPKSRCQGIKLAKNVGHQNALLAGLSSTTGDAAISIDADLQDDINVIRQMVGLLGSGCDVVYGVRDNRDTDSRFKRHTALWYYAALRLLGVEIVPNHADFRLLSRRALSALFKYTEVNLFLRAIIPLLGFQTAIVPYRREERKAGVSKYPLRRMISLALDGITSFSMRPLRFITLAGITISFAAFVVGAWALTLHVFYDNTVPGWATIVVGLGVIGGLQLLSIGVIGEYVGKIYLETKRRPHFEIEGRSPSASADPVGLANHGETTA
jgi:glycosyltransferase involved in cell wall biosynthesis